MRKVTFHKVDRYVYIVMKTYLNSFARNSLSTAIPAGGQGEGERVEGVVGVGEDGEDDDVDVVNDDEAGEGEDGEEEEWVKGVDGGSRFGNCRGEAKPPSLPPLSFPPLPSTAIPPFSRLCLIYGFLSISMVETLFSLLSYQHPGLCHPSHSIKSYPSISGYSQVIPTPCHQHRSRWTRADVLPPPAVERHCRPEPGAEEHRSPPCAAMHRPVKVSTLAHLLAAPTQ